VGNHAAEEPQDPPVSTAVNDVALWAGSINH
jgi:hypothetical protein